MKILLLGAKGQLGFELHKVLPELGEVIALSRNEVDLTNLTELTVQLEIIKPKLIVNASAYTEVDKAENEKDLANLINAKVPQLLAQYAAYNDSILIHYSTDYVFDGKKKTPYLETDNPNPLSIYGLSKLIGEEKITEIDCKHLIFRTSWLFSSHGENFLTTILNLAKQKDKLQVIDDQCGTPTSCSLLAEITVIAIKRLIIENNTCKINNWGIYNVTALGSTSWYEFAREIISYANILNIDLKINLDHIFPIKTIDYKQKAIRPRFSCLDPSKMMKSFNYNTQLYKYYLLNEIKNL